MYDKDQAPEHSNTCTADIAAVILGFDTSFSDTDVSMGRRSCERPNMGVAQHHFGHYWADCTDYLSKAYLSGFMVPAR